GTTGSAADPRTSTSTLPSCSPRASRSNAVRASASGYTRSTRGRSAPLESTRTTAAYSVALPSVEPRIVYWFQNRRRTSVTTRGPVVAPHVTRRPPLARQRSESSHVASPTFSTTTSTPRRAVSARTSWTTDCVRWL